MIKTIKSFSPRDFLAHAAILALCIGFVSSRSMFSFGLLFMGLYWVWEVRKTAYLWKNIWFLSSVMLAFIVPISDLANGSSISHVFFLKLSLPLFFVFFATFKPEGNKLALINYIVIVVMLITSILALINYFKNTDTIIQGYTVAKVMKIGKYSDHIRVSVAIACSIVIAVFEYFNSRSRYLKFLMATYAIFQFAFLHQLAARTGLVMIYIASIIYIGHHMMSRNHIKALVILPFLIFAPLISYHVFPSFYQRVGFTLYDQKFYQKMEYREGSSDGLRYYSILAGIDIFTKNKILGIGFQNLPTESGEWLKTKFPPIKDYEKIQPSSQYILQLAASGIVGFSILLVFFFGPYYSKDNLANSYFFAINFSLLCIMIFEIFLENQYGIFIYGFFTALASQYSDKK